MQKELRLLMNPVNPAAYAPRMHRHFGFMTPQLGSPARGIRRRTFARISASLVTLVVFLAISGHAAARDNAPGFVPMEGLLHTNAIADSGIYENPMLSIDAAWKDSQQLATIEQIRGYISVQIIKQSLGIEAETAPDAWWTESVNSDILLISRAWNLLESRNSILPQPGEPALSSAQAGMYAFVLIRMAKQIDDKIRLSMIELTPTVNELAHVSRPSMPPGYPAGTDPAMIAEEDARAAYMNGLSLYQQKRHAEYQMSRLSSLRTEHPVRTKEYLKKIVSALSSNEIGGLVDAVTKLEISQEQNPTLHRVLAEILPLPTADD